MKRISSGRASEPISFETHLLSSSFNASLGWLPLSSETNAEMAWPFEFVGTANDSGLGDLGVSHQRRLDFHRAQAMAADVDHVVDAAHQPEVAVGILARAVAGKVAARECRSSKSP